MNINKIASECLGEQSFKIEEYIKLHIQPKPKWLPSFIWIKLLKRLLILKIYH